MTEASARVLLDSVSPLGDRLTTMEVTFWRPILAEFNTHRILSRNSASSRAIPVRKTLEQVLLDAAIPLSFPLEQKGMQGGSELEEPTRSHAIRVWLEARDSAMRHAQDLIALGVHKSVVNRLLEPFIWHTAIVSSTSWSNLFRQRCSPLAQPEFRAVADQMKSALDASTPTALDYGQWHMPLLRPEDDRDIMDTLGYGESVLEIKKKVSAARCARVSYLTHGGFRDIDEDLRMYGRLVRADPEHASPLEHVATPHSPTSSAIRAAGNFTGWRQLRHEVLGF